MLKTKLFDAEQQINKKEEAIRLLLKEGAAKNLKNYINKNFNYHGALK